MRLPFQHGPSSAEEDSEEGAGGYQEDGVDFGLEEDEAAGQVEDEVGDDQELLPGIGMTEGCKAAGGQAEQGQDENLIPESL